MPRRLGLSAHTAPVGDCSKAMTRDCFEPRSALFGSGSPAPCRRGNSAIKCRTSARGCHAERPARYREHKRPVRRSDVPISAVWFSAERADVDGDGAAHCPGLPGRESWRPSGDIQPRSSLGRLLRHGCTAFLETLLLVASATTQANPGKAAITSPARGLTSSTLYGFLD